MGHVFDFSYLANHADPEIAQLYIDLTTDEHSLSGNWADMHNIKTVTERDNLKQVVFDAIHRLKLCHILKRLKHNAKDIKESKNDVTTLLEQRMQLEAIKKELCNVLGIAILK